MADMNMCPRSTAAFWLKGGTHTEYTWHGVRMEYMWKVAHGVAYTWNTYLWAYGIHMEYAWHSHDMNMEYTWNTNGKHMAYTAGVHM